MKKWLFKKIFKQQLEDMDFQKEYLTELLNKQIEKNSKLENELKDLKECEQFAKEYAEFLMEIIEIDDDKIKELRRELELDNIIIGRLGIYGKQR